LGGLKEKIDADGDLLVDALTSVRTDMNVRVSTD
jgi:hypothetical protein